MTQRCLAVTVISVCMLVAQPHQLAAQSANEQYTTSVGLYKQKRYTLASEGFRKFIADNPEHTRVPFARLYLGLGLVNLEDFRGAREEFRKFVKDYPQSRNRPDAMYRVGECSYQIGDYEAAETELTEYLRENSSHALVDWALSYLGDAQLARKKYQDAVVNFQRLLDEFPKSETLDDARYGLARALEKTNRVDEALKAFEAVAAQPNGVHAAKALDHIGRIHFSSRNYKLAARSYQAIAERFPSKSQAILARLNGAASMYRIGDYEGAIKLLEGVPADHSYASRAVELRGMSYMRLRDYESASNIFANGRAAHPKSDQLQSFVYHQADCERQRGNYQKAIELFVEVRKRFPKGKYDDESLHFAAESSLLLNELDQAAQFLDQFDQLHAESSLRPRTNILRGRLYSARGGDENELRAVEVLQTVLDTPDLDSRTSDLARYYLTVSQTRAGEYAKALQTGTPLEAAVQSGKSSGYGDIRVVMARAAEALGQHDKARELVSVYMSQNPQGTRRSEALALRATIAARDGQSANAVSDLEVLRSLNPLSRRYQTTLVQIAEIAWDKQNWQLATTAFKTMSESRESSTLRARGLSGYAWSLYETRQYEQAAKEFGRFAEEFPQHSLAAESAWMEAEAQLKLGKQNEAISLGTSVFRTYRPKTPNTVDAKPVDDGPEYHAFRAGQMVAVVATRLGQLDVADAAWAELLEYYPNAKGADRLIEQWAYLNLDAQKFEESDNIFRKLINDYPNSPLVPGARLALAESQLVDGKTKDAEKVFTSLLDQGDIPDDVAEAAMFQLIRVKREYEDWPTVLTLTQQFSNRFPASEYTSECRMREGEALFMQKDPQAKSILEEVRKQRLSVPVAGWEGRAWVVLAEIAFQNREYKDVRRLESELKSRSQGSRFLYQLYEIVGRSYKQQASPDFELARDYFRRAIDDPNGKGTPTAAKSQFMIGETYIEENPPDLAKARAAYLATEINYPFPEWQAPAIFQAAGCDTALDELDKAVDTYERLIKDHPDSEYAEKARQRLSELK